MKRSLLSILAIALSLVGFSQITILSTDIGQAGDSMIIGNDNPSNTMSVGGTGNQSWSFEFIVNDYNTLLFQDPSNTISSSVFPGADIAIERQSDTLFFKKNSSELSLDGLSGDVSGLTGVPLTLALNIQNDVTQIEFPSTLGNGFTDQATIDTIVNCADINASQYCTQARIKRRYLVTSNIDAFGDLETSGGTYANTLRQYYNERTIDSVWANLPIFGGPLNFIQDIDSTSFIYRWYATGEKWPVLTAYADAQGGNIISAEFQIDNLLGTVEQRNNPRCNGDCNGSAAVLGLGADPGYTYTWPASANNQTGATASGLCAGTYTVTIQDNDTDTYELDVILTDPQVVGVVGSVQYSNGTNGAIDITASGGNGTFTYTWSGPAGFTATSQDISGLEPGSYTVIVTDGKGCQVTEIYEVFSVSGVSDIGAIVFSMYPNPANEQVTIEFEGQLAHLRISDLLGNTIVDRNLVGNKSFIETSELSSGIYMIEVSTNEGTQLKKLTVLH
jgi:hypothetical protein